MAKILNSDIQILSEERTEEPQIITLPTSHNEDVNHLISFERKNQEIFPPNSLILAEKKNEESHVQPFPKTNNVDANHVISSKGEDQKITTMNSSTGEKERISIEKRNDDPNIKNQLRIENENESHPISSEGQSQKTHSLQSPVRKSKRILTKTKNGYSNFPTLPQTENEDGSFETLSERENLKILSSIPTMEKNKRGRKRGRPSKQSTSCSKKQKAPNPLWIGRWLKRYKIRRNGRKDAFYIHKMIPKLTCRSKQEVERYEKYGVRPGRKVDENGNEIPKRVTKKEKGSSSKSKSK